MNDLDIWQRRWDSLHQHMQALEALIQNFEGLPRAQTLSALVRALDDFGSAHFDFFFQGFSRRTLSLSDRFPPDYVLRQVIYRVSDDVRVLQQVFDNRATCAASDDMKRVLEEADRMAYTALRPAIERGILHQETTAITYFQKIASIRVIPYASAAIIGVPLTTISVSRDLLAIPHEVGHYIYQNGLAPREQSARSDIDGPLFRDAISQQARYEKRWLKNWLEEIFADVYGALIAGESIARSFQNLEIETSAEEFLNDDGDHPTPVVRPDIYSHVLRQRGFSAAAAALEAEWEHLKDKRPGSLPSYLIMKNGSGKPDIEEMGTIRRKLQSCIDDMLAYWPSQPQSQHTSEVDWAALYNDQLSGMGWPAKQQTATDPDEMLPEQPVIHSYEEWMAKRALGAQSQQDTMRVNEWLDILNAKGWTTEGPHSRPGPGSGP